MKKNMGSVDRVVRIVLAALVAVLYFSNVIPGTLGIVLMVLAGVFVLTSLVGYCPIYHLVGCSSCPLGESKAKG
ncbi:MAG: DUF2892 domain-containing protein [Saprospirales bacterium]|nr:DUF2892 domain-containing protein [Saprospirales bacterium]MBK7337244.1 DUF2892 domain-containing protein [Saprospirales bacterium]